MPTPPNVDTSASFFVTQQQTTAPNDLISAQIDPSQPQVRGLTTVTDPLLPDSRIRDRLVNFDPELFDLSDGSHLMRLLQALLGAAGIGGVRRQLLLQRMSSTSIAHTHFLDLDGFWGALFHLGRVQAEQMPTLADGTVLNPINGVADSDTWDAVHSRDGRYRSRITQFAKAVNQGATYAGLMAAAEAVLGAGVEIAESWMWADLLPPGAGQTVVNANSWLAVEAQYHSYGNMAGTPWGVLHGGVQTPGNTPLGNRGEIVVQPERTITEEERRQLMLVLDVLRPAGTVLTVQQSAASTYSTIAPRTAYADSNDWQVVSSVSQFEGLTTIDDDLYPNQTSVEAARPAFARYTGERWSYNSRIARINSYVMVGEQIAGPAADDQTVTYLDGTSHVYAAADGVLDSKQAVFGRLASDGVMTTYPYPPGRVSA